MQATHLRCGWPEPGRRVSAQEPFSRSGPSTAKHREKTVTSDRRGRCAERGRYCSAGAGYSFAQSAICSSTSSSAVPQPVRA
jgi:hypothetical protein